MKKMLPVLLAYVFSFNVSAQEDLSIAYFSGGSYKIRFGFDSAFLGGVSVRTAGLGGAITSLTNDAGLAVTHPAALAEFDRPVSVLNMTPPVMFNAASLIEMDQAIQDGVDSALEQYNIPQSEITYPDLDIRFGQSAVGGAGAGVMPSRYGTFGFAVSQPLGLSLDIVGSGFSTMIETSKDLGDAVTIVQFATRMSPSIQMNLYSRQFTASYGYSVTPRFKVGAALDWLSTRVDLNAFFKLDGIMLLRQEGAISGLEYAFNDPYDGSIRSEDGEQNVLDQWAFGSYTGSGWGFRFSSIFHLSRSWRLDFIISKIPDVTMNGSMEFVQNKIPALQAENMFGGDENAELFSVTDLNLAKPTLTERFENPTGDRMTLKMPGTITFGISKRTGSRSLFTLNLVQYFGEFSYQYMNYKQGLKISNAIRFGLQVPQAWFFSPETMLLKLLGVDPKASLRFGFGLITASEIKSGFAYQTGEKLYTRQSIVIPSFALGKSFQVFPGVQADVLLFTTTATLMKMSFTYNF